MKYFFYSPFCIPKALGKTLFHFFSGWVFVRLQKNESVFCAVAKNFRGVEFFFILFGLPFKAVSVEVPK